MKHSRRSFTLGTGLALIAAGSAPLRAQPAPLIEVAASSNDSTTAAVYAVKAGLFKAAGLNVDLTPMSSGSAVAAAVAGGSVQIGASSLLALITAHVKHVPFTIIASSALFDNSDANYVQLVVKKDSPLRTARDLNGKTIASPGLKDLNAIATLAWIDQNGGDSSTVKVVELSSAASVQAIAAERVDATVLATPYLSAAVDGGTARVFGNAYAAISRSFLTVGWFTTDDYAAKNRDVVARFARVMRDAAIYCNTHPTDTVDMIAEFGKLDPNVVRHMSRARFAPYLSAAMIQPLVDVAAKYKVIDATFNAQELISPSAPRG
jgi:NitT/TauT family transport system substrate-binding protein